MNSVEDKNLKKDLEEIDLDLKNVDENNNMNQQNNFEEMNNIESESKNEMGDSKDNIKNKNDYDNKEILSNDGKNKENKTQNVKDDDEDEEDNKSEKNEIKNKSEINNSQVNSGYQSYDNNKNKSSTELKDEDDNNEKNKKNKNENNVKDILSPSNSNISYRPSEYRSILQNTELTESDKLLIEKYSNYKTKNYNINNNDLYNNLGFTKRLTHNYDTLEEPKAVNYLTKYKYNSIEATPKQYLKNNYISNSKSLLENENEKPKTYLERNNLIINDIGKDVNFSWNNLDDKDDKKIEKNNLEKIIFNNSQIEKDITNSHKSNKNDDNQDFIKNLKGDYSNKRNFNKEDEDFNLNINYSYNIPRNFDKNQNLLNKTSLANYHIPHTQFSIIKKYNPNYSIFDFHRYNNFKSDSSPISNINKYSNDINSYDIQNIANKSNQNMNNDSQYNHHVNANNNNYKSILNYENKNINININNKNTNSIINNNDKSLDNNNIIINKENQNIINKSNQSIKGNEKPFTNNINNSSSIPSNSLFIPKNKSKRYKSLLFNDEKKSSFISDNKTIEKSLNNNSYFDKSDIQNNFGKNYYKNKSEFLQPYQYLPFQTIFQDNLNQNQNDDIIIKHRKGGAFRDDIKEVIIYSSPSDFYYNTLHQEFVPKTQNIGKKIKHQFSKVYRIDKNKDIQDRDRDKDINNKKYLFYFSTIRRDLINKNKSKSFKAL